VFDWTVTRVRKTGGIVADTSPPIDHVLEQEIVDKIYREWNPKSDGALVDYGGGVKAITVMMLVGAGDNVLKRIKGIGPRRAGELLESLREDLEIPYL